MISVIIPVYNQADKIIATLKSINLQTYRDLEIIIINDGSHDNPEQAFTKFLSTNNTDLNFYFFNQENAGAPAARNRGYREAKGEFLFFCDADATLVPQALELLLQTLVINKAASYAFSAFTWGKKTFAVGEFSPERLKTAPFIHTMALIRREDFPEQGWDESIKKFQDWDLWLTMLENNKVGIFVNYILFNVEPGGTISSWLPSFAYKFFPFLPAVKKYQRAMAVIKAKHNLP